MTPRWVIRTGTSLLVIGVLATGVAAPTNDGDNGAIPLMIKTRVAPTPDVVAAIAARGVKVTQVWTEISALAVTVPPSKLVDLAADPIVALLEYDQQGQVPGAAPEDGAATAAPLVAVPLPASSTPITTWNLDMTDTDAPGFDGTGVTVAVVDSGLPQNWEEFLPPGSVDVEHGAGFGAEGWGDFHSQVNAIRGVGGHIGLFPHGLAVSSVIVGFPSEVGPIGGAAPGATILPVRVINQFNFGWFSWFTAGILHVAHLKESGAVPGPMVINFSIQARGSSAILQSAIDYAISRGVLFVTIAGNFGPAPGSIAFPGRLPESITAGATGWTQEFCVPPACTSPWFFADVSETDAVQVSQTYVAGFSGRESVPGAFIDVLAPGSFVFGEWLFGPGFSEGREVSFDAVDNFIFGTSFAAPHVAGIVARMLDKNGGLTQAQAEAILRSSALPIPANPFGVFTPVWFVPPWDATATGSGLAQGAAAVTATP